MGGEADRGGAVVYVHVHGFEGAARTGIRVQPYGTIFEYVSYEYELYPLPSSNVWVIAQCTTTTHTLSHV